MGCQIHTRGVLPASTTTSKAIFKAWASSPLNGFRFRWRRRKIGVEKRKLLPLESGERRLGGKET